MGDAAEKLLEQALELSDDERVTLATRLLETVPSPHLLSIDDGEELDRRADEARRGEPGIPWEQVKASLP